MTIIKIDLNYPLIIRECVWFLSYIYIAHRLFFYSDRIKYLETLKAAKNIVLSFPAIMTYIFAILALFTVGAFGFYELKFMLLIALFAAIYLVLNFNSNTSSLCLSSTLWIVFSILACILPIASGKYLNAESSYSDSPLVESSLLTSTNDQYVTFKPTQQERINFQTNLMQVLPEFAPKVINSDGNFVINITGGDYRAFCIFGDYVSHNSIRSFNNVNSCLDTLNLARYIRPLISNFDRIPGISIDAAPQLDNTKHNESVFKNRKNDASINQIMIDYTPGGYFHHYRSIASPFFQRNISSYFANQYGPVFSTATLVICNVFSLSYFDSIFISVIGTILLLFFLLLLLPFKKHENVLIFSGFFATIWVTYANSNMMAPLLYFSRFLPSVLLVLLIYLRYKKNVSPLRFDIAIYSICALVSVYNFEYALLTLFPLIIVSAAHGFKRSCGLYLALMIFAVALKLLSASFVGSSVGVPYSVYLFSKFQGELIHPVVAVFCILLIYIIYSHKYKKNYWFDLVLGILVAFSIKPIWNGAPNHIGPLFLFMAIYFLMRTPVSKRSTVLYISFVVASSIYSISAFNNFKLNANFADNEYVESRLSRLFLVDATIVAKAIELEELKFDNDLLISQMDSNLSMLLERNLTGPYTDLSTTGINLDSNLLLAYCDASCRVIVSKELQNDHMYYLGRDILDLNIGIEPFKIGKSSHNRVILQSLIKIFRDNGFNKCGESKSFNVYCRSHAFVNNQ